MNIEEKRAATEWLAHALAGAPPFSFRLGGSASSWTLGRRPTEHESTRHDDGSVMHRVVYRDDNDGLECLLDVTEYADSPAVEWVVRLRNIGHTNTPLIEDIQALDLMRTAAPRDQVRLHSSKGTRAAIDDFALVRQELRPGGDIALASAGSRAHLPFINLEMPDEGMIVGVGWTGNWTCRLDRSTDGPVRIRAGMSKTCLILHPDEEIRTPRMLLLFWRGEALRGHNLLRRHLVAHHLPHAEGKEPEAPICHATWGGLKTANHLKLIRFLQENELDYDCYWVDAGWYGRNHETAEFQDLYVEDWAAHIGHWRVNEAVHPEGLRPIADAAHTAGMRFLLWFSPYTVVEGAPLVANHPEWLVDPAGTTMKWARDQVPVTQYLLDISRPDARQALLEQISALIQEHGVDWFRDDSLLPFGKDEPDRQGIAEIRCVEAFYAFWDELRERHPGLMIDNCGGGGTRIDLETISRSFVLHRSDYNCSPYADPIGFQVGTYGLAYWVPLVGGAAPAHPGSAYHFRSSMSGGLPFSLFHAAGFGEAPTAPAPDYPVEWHRRMLAQYRRARRFYIGDFYPLTDCTLSTRDWLAYQLDRPDLGEGIVVALRRTDSPFVTAQFPLHGVDETADYEIEDADGEAVATISGAQLSDTGVTVTMASAPASRLLFYRRTLG